MLVFGGVFIVMVSMVVMVLVGGYGVGRTPRMLRTYKGDFLRV